MEAYFIIVLCQNNGGRSSAYHKRSVFDQTILLNLLQNTQSSPKFTDILILIIYLPLGKKLEISLCHLAIRGRPQRFLVQVHVLA